RCRAERPPSPAASGGVAAGSARRSAGHGEPTGVGPTWTRLVGSWSGPSPSLRVGPVDGVHLAPQDVALERERVDRPRLGLGGQAVRGDHLERMLAVARRLVQAG